MAPDRSPLANPAQEQWKEVIPETDLRLEDFRLAGGKLVVQYSHNAVAEMKIFEPDGKPAGKWRCPNGEVSQVSTDVGAETKMFFSLHIVCNSAYDLSLRSGERRGGNVGEEQRAD